MNKTMMQTNSFFSRIAIVIAVCFFATIPVIASAHSVSHDDDHSVNTFCPETGELTYSEFASARLGGFIDITLEVSTTTGKATSHIANRTGCTIPMSLDVYKMFDQTLSHQEFFDGTGLVSVASSTNLQAQLPSCMAQVDLYYGLGPTQLLDSNPYSGPTPPVVLTWAFTYNNGTSYFDASGQFCTHDVLNTPPTITLVGSNPLTLTAGATFADPGATANDTEDGDLTSHIVVTGGPVNTAIVGTTTLVYTVTDSGGLTASTTRTVVITSPSIGTQECFIGDNLSNTTKVLVQNLNNEAVTLQDILTTEASGTNANSDQKNYQIWHNGSTQSTISVTFVDRGYAAAGNVFGYYNKGHLETFVPIFASGDGVNNTYPNVQKATAGQTFSTTLPSGDIAFAVNSDFTGTHVWGSESALNNGDIHAISYDVPSAQGSYIVAFEDLPLLSSDHDYNDVVVKMTATGCTHTVVNTPPSITLIGNNPINLHVGDTFTDPGATATDTEDGDLTSHIVVTGSVATSTVGSYTLTYTVTDSGGLTASTTRTVVVSNPDNGGGNNGNTLSVCLVIARYNNTVATTSANLALGAFSFNLATTSNFASSTIQTPSFTTSGFTPNRKLISTVNDAQCISYTNLAFGTYYYSQASTTGVAYQVSKYNDGAVTPINSLSDFFPFSSTTPDADGIVVFDSMHTNQTVTLLEVATNTPPTITLVGANPLALTTGATFTDPGATATDTEDGDLTSHIVVTGTVDMTTPATYTRTYTVTDSGGLTASTTRTVVVSNPNNGGGGSTPDANLAVTKTADKSTANVGDTVTYTITVVDNGPDNANGVSVSDTLPAGLTFVSATSTVGTFSTTTSMWTIGNLLNGSSTTLTLIATVNTGTEGQKITNIATASSTINDSNTANNTSGVDVTVNVPNTTVGNGCTSNCGGGGGGNGPIVGSIPSGGNGPIITTPVGVPVTSTPNACLYLRDYLHIGWNNDPNEVRKLQVFLRDLEGHSNLQVTGVYDDATVVAVNEFQVKYGSDIIVPWDGTYNPSSFTYILTKKKVNEIYCKIAFPVTVQEQSVIDAYRAFINDIQTNGVQVVPGSTENEETSTTTGKMNDEIGLGDKIYNFFSNNLAIGGPNSSSTKLAITNFAAAVLGFPINWMKGIVSPSQCLLGQSLYCKWLDVILGLLIVGLLYLLFRNGLRKDKTVEEINRDLDLK